MEQTLGKRIMTNRKRLGLTQDQLAEKLGVTAQAVSKWENDQSCPDISMLPQLAEIFEISTDALLGCEHKNIVHEAEIIAENDSDDTNTDDPSFKFKKGGWEIRWDNSRKGALGMAVLVLLVGCLLLTGEIKSWTVSFWDILWPSSLLVFGLFGLVPKFSFFRLGCSLFGGYFLLDNLGIFHFELGGNLVFPALLLLFGCSLLVDALKKPKNPVFHFHHNEKSNAKHKTQFQINENSFDYSASFSSCTQLIELDYLTSGTISTNFGDYSLDLSGVKKLSPDCSLDASCSFGELRLMVPSKYIVKQNNSTAFAQISTSGYPDPEPAGCIYLNANVSFGEIQIRYI